MIELPTGVFSWSGMYLRDPGSGAESINWDEFKLDFHAIAINVGDHAPAEWDTIVRLAAKAHVSVLPWARCYTEEAVVNLCNTARKMPARAVIVNAEAELLDGRISESCIAAATAGLDACVSTEPWVGETQLELLKHVDVHLQLFPQETDIAKKSRDCRSHAYDRGAHRAMFMLGVHDLEPRDFPPLQEPVWIYTLDDCFLDWREFRPHTIPSLTVPYTGPLYGPSSPKWGTRPKVSNTAKALKIILHRAGFAYFPRPDRHYNEQLEQGMRRLQRFYGITQSGAYGLKCYAVIRELASATAGETYALCREAEELIRLDQARLSP